MFNPPQIGEFLTNRGESLADQVSNVRTGFNSLVLDEQQLTYLAEREAEFLSGPDKPEMLDIQCAVEPKPTLAPGRLAEQARLLVKANCIDAQASLVRYFADLNTARPLRLFSVPSTGYDLEGTPESSAAQNFVLDCPADIECSEKSNQEATVEQGKRR